MWNIKLSHPNPLPVEEAKRLLGARASDYARFYGVATRWEGDRMVLSGSLLNGHIDFGATSVDVDVTLGAGAQTAKDRHDVESGIKMAFAQYLGAG